MHLWRLARRDQPGHTWVFVGVFVKFSTNVIIIIINSNSNSRLYWQYRRVIGGVTWKLAAYNTGVVAWLRRGLRVCHYVKGLLIYSKILWCQSVLFVSSLVVLVSLAVCSSVV